MRNDVDLEKIAVPIQKKPLAHVIIERFRDLVVNGHLRPGTRLPPERRLSEMWGVSRASLREALRALEVLGVIELKHGQSAFLKTNWQGAGRIYADFLVLFNRISHQDLFETRRILETSSAVLAAERRTDVDIASLVQILDQMERNIGTSVYFRYGIEFHRGLVRASHNNMLASSLEVLEELLEEARDLTTLPGEHEFAIHKEIVQAIIDRDAELTRRLMERHFDQVQRRMSVLGGTHRTDGEADT